MPDYRLELELGEPLFCGSKHAVSNEMVSLEFIPGASLRGAIAAELRQLGRSAELPAWFSALGPRWTPALPVVPPRFEKPPYGPDAVLVPMPLSFLREKRDADPFAGEFGVFNGLHSCPPDNHAEYEERTGLPVNEKARGSQQWTRLGAKWLVVSQGRPVAAYQPRPSTSMHVGLHYGRQANRDQALFSRRSMAARNTFVAWVQDSAGALADFPSSATIGKRTSAGNGFVSLRWRQGAFPWLGHGGDDRPSAVIHLISDAIVLDRNGSYLQGLNSEFWQGLLGPGVTVKSAAAATRRIRVWSNTWGLPKQHMLAISAGSVFRLELAEVGSSWKAALDRLAQAGLGCLRHEGFGWVSVNPPWLADAFHRPQPDDLKEKARQKRREPQPQAWPGLEKVDRELLLKTYQSASQAYKEVLQQTKVEPKVIIQKVGDLASYAARVSKPADVANYLRELSERPNPWNWDTVSKLIGGLLPVSGEIELTRFFLNAIETLHD